MSDYEIKEALQLRNQRFTAALKFMIIKMEQGSGKALVGPSLDESIALADLLIEKLETPT